MSGIRSRLAGAALVAAAVAVPASPAHATTVVDCSLGPVTLADVYGDYQLAGTCSQVTIAAANITVSLSGATRVDVQGVDAHVTAAGGLGVLSVVDSGAVVTAPTIHRANLAGTGTHLTAGRIDRLAASGTQVAVHAHRAGRATISGTSGRFVFTRLPRLAVSGTSDHVRVRRGTTRVTNTGTHNLIRVHHRPTPAR